MASKFNGFGTSAIHAGQDPESWDSMQMSAPISMSAIFKWRKPGDVPKHSYSRSGNPTRQALEQCIAALEDAKYASIFSSGSAAVSAVFDILSAGSEIICAGNVYSGTVRITQKISKRHAKNFKYIDFIDEEKLLQALNPNTKMIFFETPSNPLLTVIDIEKIVTITKAYCNDILIVLDNTFMTPYFQRPLKFGVDIVVHSLSKYINGHSDVIMGAVVTNKEEIYLNVQQTLIDGGAVPSPFDCWLSLRGVKTLHVRMERHFQNALAVAQFLEAHPKIEKVLYPSLKSHPQYDIQKKQATGSSGIIALYIKGGVEEATAFVTKLQVITCAESLGAIESLISLPCVMAHRKVPEDLRKDLGITDNFMRLSIGLENIDDLIEDLKQALE